MSEFQIRSGKTVFEAESKLTFLARIESGRVKMQLPGRDIILSKGDVIGLLDINKHIHSCRYTSLEDTIVESYPCANSQELAGLLASPDDTAVIFAGFEKLLNALFEQYNLARYDCMNLFSYLQNSYSDYCMYSEQAMLTPKELPGLSELSPLMLEETLDAWKSQFYTESNAICKQLAPSLSKAYPTFFAGLLTIGCEDCDTLNKTFQSMHAYIQELSSFLFSEDATDLFDLYSGLILALAKEGNDYEKLKERLDGLFEYASTLLGEKAPVIEIHRKEYEKTLLKLKEYEDINATFAQKAADNELLEQFKDSLNQILTYGNYPSDQSALLRRAVSEYKRLPDKSASSDEASSIRKQITEHFYKLYEVVFIRSLKDLKPPKAVSLFLNYGYMDETVAGSENIISLLNILNQKEPYTPSKGVHVYTIYEWLKEIYYGHKEPRKNEFDLDYKGYVDDLLRSGNITEEAAKKLLSDPIQKVSFEISNMFPVANRMTYGRILTFCPIFSDHNVSKPLDVCALNTTNITQALEAITKVDYSAFYRPIMYSSREYNIGREYLYEAYLPDVILMPNVGIRGAMWQELEGKDRTSSATFILPIFSLENISLVIARLVGEYRWEICRRLQGSRWNDVTDHSLTAEYYDYLQFFRKNNELSTETKEKISLQLKKCKSNFKEYFLIDYICYVLYEGNGTPRLNKFARNLLFTYCPFTATTCDKLLSNPMYEPMIKKRQIFLGKEKRRIDSLIYRCKKYNSSVPAEIEKLRKYLDM